MNRPGDLEQMHDPAPDQECERLGRRLILALCAIALTIDLAYIIWAFGTGVPKVITSSWIRLLAEGTLFYFLWRRAAWARWGLIVLCMGVAVAGVCLLFLASRDKGLLTIVSSATIVLFYSTFTVVLLGSKTLRDYVRHRRCRQEADR
jgi:hypothetical protein